MEKLYIRGMKRIYPKTTGYWVYIHTTPNRMIYIGMSKQQPKQRWKKLMYKGSSLEHYIAEYGWENIQHKVLIDGLTKNEAEQWEDKLIIALSMNGLCINERRSGGIKRDDKKAYDKQRYEDHKEEKKAYDKQRNSTPEGKIYMRVSAYNRYNPDKAIETPMEAKQKYLQWGYIPAYIKNDDLHIRPLP